MFTTYIRGTATSRLRRPAAGPELPAAIAAVPGALQSTQQPQPKARWSMRLRVRIYALPHVHCPASNGAVQRAEAVEHSRAGVSLRAPKRINSLKNRSLFRQNSRMLTTTRPLGSLPLGLLGIMLLGMQGCGPSSPTLMAQAAVSTFHSQLNAAQFESIWNEADDLFRTKTSHEDYAKLAIKVHDKLGQVVNTRAQGWSVNYLNAQTRVVLHQQTQFQHGSGLESFMYIVRGSSVKLAGYNEAAWMRRPASELRSR